MLLRTKLHGKNAIHEYDHEFTNADLSIRVFVASFVDGFGTPLMDGRVVPLSVKTLIFYH